MAASPTLTVRDAMAAPAVGLDVSSPVREAIELLRRHRGAHLCVFEAGKLAGLISDREVYRSLPLATGDARSEYESVIETMNVERVMSRIILTIGPETTLSEAMRQLTTSQLYALPVLEGGQVLGVLTIADCIHGLSHDPLPVPASPRRFAEH